MRRIVEILLVMSVIAASCSSGEDAADTTTVATVAPTTTAATTTTTTATTTTQAPTTTTQASTTTAVDVDAVRADILDVVVGGLEDATGTAGEFDRVDVILFDTGVLEIEGHLLWASEDRQADSQWQSIVFVATLLAGGILEKGQAVNLFDGADPRIHMVTVSVDGDYRYESLTDWDTLVAVGARSLGFEGWVEAAGAGFR